MALSASAVFEVRAGLGVDTNSGAYVSGGGGTDFSQQNAAQATFNGTSVTATSAAASATIVLTGYTVSAADVGNTLRVSGGVNFTVSANPYQILSVNVGANSWTLDRNVTTGAGSAMTGAMGGALLTLATAISSAVAHNTVYCVGTFTLTAALAFSYDSRSGLPFQFIGYTTTRNDKGLSTWTSSTNSIDIIQLAQAFGLSFANISMSSTAGTRGNGINAKNTNNSLYVSLTNCVLDGFALGIRGNFNVDWAIQGLNLNNCEVKNCTSHGIFNSGATVVAYSFIHDNTGAGIQIAGGGVDGSLFLNGVILYQNGANGVGEAVGAIPPTRSLCFTHCAFAKNTGAGILCTPPLAVYGANSIFSTNTTFGIDNGGASASVQFDQVNLAFFNNGTAARQGVQSSASDITLTASPYVSLGSDFSLNNTAGGGAACRAAGFPGVLIAGGTGFANVGPLDPAAGGTTVIAFGPNITQFIQGEQR